MNQGPIIKELSSKDLKEIVKNDQDNPTFRAIFFILGWFLFLRLLFHIATSDKVQSITSAITDFYNWLF